MSQNGQIGLALNTPWILPYHDIPADQDAANRALAFSYGWYKITTIPNSLNMGLKPKTNLSYCFRFMEPLKSGSYPTDMVNYVKKRLPEFSMDESLMVKGSYDFIGINYYTSQYAIDVPCKSENMSSYTDSCVYLTCKYCFNGVGLLVHGLLN